MHHAFILLTEVESEKKCEKIADAFAPTHGYMSYQLGITDYIILLWKHEWTRVDCNFSLEGRYIYGKFRNTFTEQETRIFGVHLLWKQGHAQALDMLLECIRDLIQGKNWIIFGDFNQKPPTIKCHNLGYKPTWPWALLRMPLLPVEVELTTS